MKSKRRREFLIFVLIITVASFFRFYQIGSAPPGLYPDEALNGNDAVQSLEGTNGGFKLFYSDNNGREGLFVWLQAGSIKLFGNESWALRIVSAIIGILTVIGLYLLTRELFSIYIAQISSFLMAISFWHVNFSRIGFRAIMVPFILVYAFYFLWRALKKSETQNYLYAGIFGGLGFYTYISYRVAPLIAILVFINFWWYLKKDFTEPRYELARNKLLKGFVILFLITILVASPLIFYFINNPEDFLSRAGSSLSVFSQERPWKELSSSIIRTLAMFNFAGDYNQRHNLSGAPMIPWPIGITFVIGFIKELKHWLSRKHGHFSTAHTLLFSWFFVMLLPGFLSIEAPHALRTIGVIPVAMVFAGQGVWWVFDKLGAFYNVGSEKSATRPASHNEANFSAILTLIILLTAFGLLEYARYFKVWAKDAGTAESFNSEYVELGRKLKSMPRELNKYVLVNTDGVLVNGIPMPAQTVMFITDTATKEKQKEKNIYYLTEKDFDLGNYDKINSAVVPLKSKNLDKF